MLRKAVSLTAASFALLVTLSWSAESAGKSDAEQIVRIQAAVNKAQVNKYIPVVYDLKHVNPYDVVRWIHRTIQVEEGAVFTFASPDGNSGKVLVVCPKEQVPALDQLMKEIDKPNLTTSTGIAKTYRLLKHRSVAVSGHIDTLTAYGQKGSFKAVTDPQTNAVYLEDTPVAQEDLLKMYNEQFDVPTPEVASEVTIYEVNVSSDGALGLDFAAWKNGPGRNLFALGGFTEFGETGGQSEKMSGGLLDGGGYLNPSPMYDTGSNLLGLPGHRMSSDGYNAAYYYQVPSAYFDYLTVKGKAQVIGKTRLAVLNAHQGSISTGEQILFYLTQNGAAPTGGLRPPDYPLDPLNKASRGDQVVHIDITPNNQYDIPLQQQNGQLVPSLGRSSDLANGPIFPDNRTVVGQQTAREVGGQSLKGFTFDRATGQTVALNRNIAAAEAGVFLDLIPVIADDKITFDLAYSVVTLTGFDAEGRPQLASRADKGTVQVKDGAELLLGGMTRDARVQKTQKVPILGSIPVLGYWFGGEVTTAQKSMVVIVMKNTVVKNFNTVQGEDADLLAKVKGEQPAPLPADEYGWDMYLFNREARQ